MKKRINKQKDQIRAEMAYQEKQKAKVEKEKYIAKTVFPLVENLKTVYDAQTAFNAASGYIQYALIAQEVKLKISELSIDLSKQEESDIGTAIKEIIKVTSDIDAKTVADLLERMGQKLAEFVTAKHLKDPMTIKSEEFIA